MAGKTNNTTVEDVSGTSQYDGMLVLRDSHSLPGHYLRTRESLTVVKSYFDTFDITYDGKNPKIIKYYSGTKAHLTTIAVRADVSGDLASTYFIISGGNKDVKYVVWFSVDGSGTPPGISNTIELEVAINENDTAGVVAYAVQMILKSLGNVFVVDRTHAVLNIKTVKLGLTNNTLDGGTGFTIQNDAGTRELVDTVNLTYSNDGYPIWQGQELIEYKYNIYTARFELDETFDIELETTASNFSIVEVDVPVANTPVTINIPDNTKKFSMQAKIPNSYINIIDQISAKTYKIRYGDEKLFEDMNTISLSFDIETDKDNNKIEIMLFN